MPCGPAGSAPAPARIQEFLELQEVAVGVAREEAIDVELLAARGRAFGEDALGEEVAVPAIDVLRDEGDDYALGLDVAPGADLADSEERGRAGLEDPAAALVQHLLEAEHIAVETACALEVIGVDPGDVLAI